jgi:hypothetical protein
MLDIFDSTKNWSYSLDDQKAEGLIADLGI